MLFLKIVFYLLFKKLYLSKTHIGLVLNCFIFISVGSFNSFKKKLQKKCIMCMFTFDHKYLKTKFKHLYIMYIYLLISYSMENNNSNKRNRIICSVPTNKNK